MRKPYAGLLYISPWLIGFCLLTLYPFAASLWYSFTDYSMVRPPVWTGLQNYVAAFRDEPDFYLSLKATGLYVLMAVPAKLVVALLVAMLLNVPMKGIGLFRTVYYLPSILGGSVAVSVLWRFLFMREGLVNGALAFLQLPAVDWLGSPNTALFTISLLPVWEFGSSMVIFLAGLKQIPKELSEAATADGASKAAIFFRITLPMLTPVILFNLIMQTINALQQFTAAFVITGGGPVKSTYVYGLMLYDQAFRFFRMGYASALSWIQFVIIVAVTFLMLRSSRRWAHYEDGGAEA